MAAYNPYAQVNQQANGQYQQSQASQQRTTNVHNVTSFQQSSPYDDHAMAGHGGPYGGSDQVNPHGSMPSQSSSAMASASMPMQQHGQPIQPGIGDSGSVSGLTSQLQGLGMGTESGNVRPNKKKNRHAYHNLDQSTVAAQVFNQNMGNAPQYVNQDSDYLNSNAVPQTQHTGYASNLQDTRAPFSPGLQQQHQQQVPSPGFMGQNMRLPSQNATMPIPTGPSVSGQGKVDPEQIPSVPRLRDEVAQFYLDHVYPTMEQHLPPPGGIPFVAHDQGNSSPKFARLTLNNIPASSDALAQTGLPLGIVLQPLAALQAGEQAIPVLDFGDVGPPRCRRCRAYINPFMVFTSGGNKLVCNMCTFPNDVSADYFAPTDPSGVRVDRPQRPELTTGTVEFLVPKEYWAKEPVGMHWLFVIDASQDAVEKGLTQAICQGILDTLYPADSPQRTSDDTEEASDLPASGLPHLGCKVGFVTFDRVVQFYNCHEKNEQPQMLVMPDVEETFVPLGADGLFVDPVKSKSSITTLLNDLPKLFSRVKSPEPVLLPALETAIASLAATGGKIICSLATLPTLGPGRLFLRDKNDMHGIETEKKLFQTEHPGWRRVAAKAVENGVGVDFFIAAPGGKYMDIATIGHVAAVSGGEVYFYPNFHAPRDAAALAQEIKHTLTRETGYQALMKVRCSNGLQVSAYHGNFLQHNFGADLEFGVIDADKAVAVMFSYDGKLDAKLDAHFQCALLYTTSGGERRVRCTNTVASVAEGVANCMKFIDQDAVVNVIAKEASSRMLERSLKDVRNAITEKTIDILAGYRKNVSTTTPTGQLVLPENLKEFGMYMLGLVKCRAFKAGHEPSDRRTHMMRLLRFISPTTLTLLLYPRILPLHNLSPESGFLDAQTGQLVVPASIRASFGRIEEGGAYLLDDGQICILWLHAYVSPNLLEDLFGPGITTLQSIDPAMSTLPVLDTHLNAQVRNILAYWGSFRGSKSGMTVPIQIARQGIDGSEFEFARMLVEDRNNEAQSYVDWLVNVHRNIQMELAGQRKKDDSANGGTGGGGGGLGVEGAVAGLTNLFTGKEN